MSSIAQRESKSFSSLKAAAAEDVRQAIRRNEYAGHTAGLCDGLLQCNLVILPEQYAADFEAYCQSNTVACPLLGKSPVGDYHIDNLGEAIDLRTDLPLYNVYKDGKLNASVQDIKTLWRTDLVAFAIGCSFTFERALIAAGINMRHIEENATVPMFKTDIPTKAVGQFEGPMVVSMRPIKPSDVEKVDAICASFPHAHGAPIHVGDAQSIGISDLTQPDWGDAVSIKDGEIPVFWGCGVTTQNALERARPELCITHSPGAMLITQIDENLNSDSKCAELT